MNFDFLLRPIAMRRDLHAAFELAFNQFMPFSAVVYDIGCGQKPFAIFLADRVSKHIGVDLADGFYKPEHVDLIGTAYAVPAEDGVADVVILSQVIEHLESPMLAMKEAHRLLKPGGLVFLSFPFLYPQHAPPRDYLRYTEFYLASMLARDGFELIEQRRIGGFWYLMGMFATMYFGDFNRGPLKSSGLVKVALAILSWFFLLMHKCEGLALRMAGKNPELIRARWTANYLAVLRKKSDALLQVCADDPAQQLTAQES